MHEWEFAEFDRQHGALVRSHVERCLMDLWQTSELVTDADGDYPFRRGTAACWVSVMGNADGVQVSAHAAIGLRSTPALRREVNELNAAARWVRVSVHAGVVHVSRELHWTEVNRVPLGHAIDQVGKVADEIGLMLAMVHGGRTPFPAQSDDSDQTSDEGAA